jgi:hypothetical protein
MMDIIANPLYVAYFALLIAVLTAIKVFVPGSEGQTDSSPARPAPATAQPAAPVAPVVAPSEEEEAVVAAIVAAIALCEGGGFTVKSIRPAEGGANLWVASGRLAGVSN